MSHIKLFEKFVKEEEDSNIYQSQGMSLDSPEKSDFDIKEWEREKNIEAGIYRTWINDYFIPMSEINGEKEPEFRALVSSAKAWLKKQSGITSVPKGTSKELRWTNGEILHRLYDDYSYSKQERNRFPLEASMYDLIKAKSL